MNDPLSIFVALNVAFALVDWLVLDAATVRWAKRALSE